MNNDPVNFTDPNGLEAWAVTQHWDENQIQAYRDSVQARVAQYDSEGRAFTCEDLALTVLIDHAEENGLPVRITNNSGIFGTSRTIESTSDEFSSKSEFVKEVLRTTGANDLINPSNSVATSYPGVGDLVLLDSPNPNRPTMDGRYEHVQLVTSVSENTIGIVQGNLPDDYARGIFGANYSDDPGASNYAGVAIESASYDRNSGTYTRNRPVSNAYATFGAVNREWNFEGMNCNE